MKLKKLKKIVALVTVITTLFTSGITQAATINQEKVTNDISSSMLSKGLYSTANSNENVLKVDVDDNGSVNYSVPKATNNMEDKEFSWDNALVYFVMTDRFVNGDKSNDHSYGRSVGEVDADNYENRVGTFHGGDLKGLTSKLDDGYFDKLGINAIWISAPYEQIHGAVCGNGFKHYAYHGYWALDFSNMDANMGTEEDLEKFIDTAHSHGIRVIFDVVMNHTGYVDPVTASEYGIGKLSDYWKDIYYKTSESQYTWDMDYTGGTDSAGPTRGMLQYDADWTGFFGHDWIRLIGDRFKGFDGKEGTGLQLLTNGLPDFKTENNNEVSLPTLLEKKWKREGRYEQETRELNEYFAKGHRRTVTQYLVKWLTDWVREYGVDGFRCDTAKHVELSVWKQLKDEGINALKEWRANNPNKPGAKWKDDFWMTAEDWDWPNGDLNRVNNDSYYSNGFDSKINFGYQGNAFTSGSNLVNVYQEYADKVNGCKNQVLSYISTHDTKLQRGDMIKAGTSLVLCPGGVQIFYGDETNRPGSGPEGQSTRSHMNWNSIDQKVLTHWQKVGTFRKNHLAVGAGQQKKLNSTTVGRTYSKNGYDDKVVLSFPGNGGSVEVPVNGIFTDGQEVTDAYTGKKYTVSGNKVNVQADSNGVVLLESNGPSKPYVSISPESQNYYSDSIEVTLSAGKDVTNTKYTIDGGSAKSFTNGDKIAVGKGTKVGDKTIVKVTGKDSDGNTLTASATYTRIEKPKTLTVHIKDTTNAGPYNAYVYSKDESTKYAGAWPGTAMTAESNGWYVYETEATTTGLVIYNGSWGQYPESRQPGIEVTGEMWIKDKVAYDHNPELEDEEGKVIVKYVDEDGNEVASSKTLTGKVGESYKTSAVSVTGYKLKTSPSNASGKYTKNDITVTYVYEKDSSSLKVTGTASLKSPQTVGSTIRLTANASGAQGTVKYAISVIDKDGFETVLKVYSTTKYVDWKPTEAGEYTIKFMAKDSKNRANTTIEGYAIKEVEKVKINSYKASLSSPQEVGKSIKLTTTASGGTGKYIYRFDAVKDGKEKVLIQNYSSSNTATWKPTEAGVYTIYFRAKDSANNSNGAYKSIAKFVVKETEPVVINSFTASKASPQTVGTTVALKVNATAQSSVTYKYWAYNLGSSWKSLSGFTTNNSINWTPTDSGKYLLGVDVKDAKGNIVSKVMEFNVTDKVTTVQENNSKIKYTGKWKSFTGTKYNGKTKKRSYSENESLTFKFTGTGLSIISTTSNNCGIAEVTIDGVVYSADMYSSSTKYQQEVLKVTGLSNKTHTITIKNIGLHSGKSKGIVVDVEAFKIFNGNII